MKEKNCAVLQNQFLNLTFDAMKLQTSLLLWMRDNTANFLDELELQELGVQESVSISGPSCAKQHFIKCKHLFKCSDTLTRHSKNCKGRVLAAKKQPVLAAKKQPVLAAKKQPVLAVRETTSNGFYLKQSSFKGTLKDYKPAGTSTACQHRGRTRLTSTQTVDVRTRGHMHCFVSHSPLVFLTVGGPITSPSAVTDTHYSAIACEQCGLLHCCLSHLPGQAHSWVSHFALGSLAGEQWPRNNRWQERQHEAGISDELGDPKWPGGRGRSYGLCPLPAQYFQGFYAPGLRFVYTKWSGVIHVMPKLQKGAYEASVVPQWRRGVLCLPTTFPTSKGSCWSHSSCHPLFSHFFKHHLPHLGSTLQLLDLPGMPSLYRLHLRTSSRVWGCEGGGIESVEASRRRNDLHAMRIELMKHAMSEQERALDVPCSQTSNVQSSWRQAELIRESGSVNSEECRVQDRLREQRAMRSPPSLRGSISPEQMLPAGWQARQSDTLSLLGWRGKHEELRRIVRSWSTLSTPVRALFLTGICWLKIHRLLLPGEIRHAQLVAKYQRSSKRLHDTTSTAHGPEGLRANRHHKSNQPGTSSINQHCLSLDVIRK
ncbi:hypothetical protein PR048_032016 [Dryococelus australis]|uniref:Uncharacterized protein n=1 Tax=Dryococelus australis TaxID=614101 RepID=A0ABQ9G6Y5_9NEOP|nr:hypothetical protein PR048_032016 [Dryococelus australis]